MYYHQQPHHHYHHRQRRGPEWVWFAFVVVLCWAMFNMSALLNVRSNTSRGSQKWWKIFSSPANQVQLLTEEQIEHRKDMFLYSRTMQSLFVSKIGIHYETPGSQPLATQQSLRLIRQIYATEPIYFYNHGCASSSSASSSPTWNAKNRKLKQHRVKMTALYYGCNYTCPEDERREDIYTLPNYLARLEKSAASHEWLFIAQDDVWLMGALPWQLVEEDEVDMAGQCQQWFSRATKNIIDAVRNSSDAMLLADDTQLLSDDDDDDDDTPSSLCYTLLPGALLRSYSVRQMTADLERKLKNDRLLRALRRHDENITLDEAFAALLVLHNGAIGPLDGFSNSWWHINTIVLYPARWYF